MIRIHQRNYISLITGFPMIPKHHKKHSTLNVSTSCPDRRDQTNPPQIKKIPHEYAY